MPLRGVRKHATHPGRNGTIRPAIRGEIPRRRGPDRMQVPEIPSVPIRHVHCEYPAHPRQALPARAVERNYPMKKLALLVAVAFAAPVFAVDAAPVAAPAAAPAAAAVPAAAPAKEEKKVEKKETKKASKKTAAKAEKKAAKPAAEVAPVVAK